MARHRISRGPAIQPTPDLRAAIAHHQGTARGVAVEPAQIIITSGRTESLNLIARMFLS